MGWDKLPVEIAAIIFVHLDPADLISIMSSCHAVLDLYQASEPQIKDSIKARLGDNYLDLVLYESAPICLSIKQESWSKFKSENGNTTYPEWMLRIRQIQRQFISICFDKDLASPLLTLPQFDRPTLGTLHRFLKHLRKIDQFVFYYMHWVRDMMPYVSGGLQKDFNTTPSAAERVRLRRGFIRYEMMCQLTCRSRWNVMLGVLDGADEASASDRERAVRQLTMSESGFLGEIPYVVVAEVTSIACYVFSCHREMLMEFFEMLFNSRTSITPTGEEVAEELEPDDQPGSNREFIPDDWEKENLLYLSSAVGMGLGYLEKVQRLSDKGRPWFLRTVLGHFQPAEHSHCLGLLRIWDELVRPVEEQGGTFEAELPTRMLPQVHHDPPPYDASSYPGFDHIYYITNLIEHGWPFWDLDRTVALDLSLGLGSTYSESIWRVLHTGREEELILSCPFWLPEHEWQPIIKKMLLPDFDASDLLNQLMTDLMETTFGMTIGSRHGRRWEKDDETKLSLEERADRAKNRLEFFRELMNNLDRHNGLGPAGSIGH